MQRKKRRCAPGFHHSFIQSLRQIGERLPGLFFQEFVNKPATVGSMADCTEILADLVRRPSVNPMGRALSGHEYLEGRVTEYLLNRLRRVGITAVRQHVSPGRENVVAVLPATRSGSPVLLWDAHQDTVPVDGMTIEPFYPTIKNGQLFGRGACDVKGGMASMVAALEDLSTFETRHASVVFVASVNEEFGFSGAKAFTTLLRRSGCESDKVAEELVRSVSSDLPDMVVVAEPTGLHLVTQHKGAVRWRMTVRGQACHSSYPEKGLNAIYSASRVALVLESLAQELSLRHSSHPCGAPTLSVGTIHGGMGVNLVPDRVVLEIDRRLVPGEDPAISRQEVIDYISANCPAAVIDHEEPFLASAGLSNEGVGAAAAAASLRDAVEKAGIPFVEEVARYGTNACVYAAAGLPCVVFGPGSISQAHTADEWVDLREVEQAKEILKNIVGRNGSA